MFQFRSEYEQKFTAGQLGPLAEQACWYNLSRKRYPSKFENIMMCTNFAANPYLIFLCIKFASGNRKNPQSSAFQIFIVRPKPWQSQKTFHASLELRLIPVHRVIILRLILRQTQVLNTTQYSNKSPVLQLQLFIYVSLTEIE